MEKRSKSSTPTPKTPDLIDAITYAKRLGCTHLVDAATSKTIVIAAATSISAPFPDDEDFWPASWRCTKTEGEKMPTGLSTMNIRSFTKSAPSPTWPTSAAGGVRAISAAWFLREFVDDTRGSISTSWPPAWLDSKTLHGERPERSLRPARAPGKLTFAASYRSRTGPAFRWLALRLKMHRCHIRSSATFNRNSRPALRYRE